MDHQRFDALARRLAAPRSRRSFLRVAVGAVVAGLIARPPAKAAAQPCEGKTCGPGCGCGSGFYCSSGKCVCDGSRCDNGCGCVEGMHCLEPFLGSGGARLCACDVGACQVRTPIGFTCGCPTEVDCQDGRCAFTSCADDADCEGGRICGVISSAAGVSDGLCLCNHYRTTDTVRTVCRPACPCPDHLICTGGQCVCDGTHCDPDLCPCPRGQYCMALWGNGPLCLCDGTRCDNGCQCPEGTACAEDGWCSCEGFCGPCGFGTCPDGLQCIEYWVDWGVFDYYCG